MISKKHKIVHIHSDAKFVYEVENYKLKDVESLIIFLGKEEELNETYRKACLPISPVEKNVQSILSICQNANLVVINYFSPYLQNLVLQLPENISILWRFFGGEIYVREPELIYSKLTLQQRSIEKRDGLILKIKKFIYNKLYYKDPFDKALKRINFFAGVIDDEYQFLTSLGYKLPKFVQVPFNLSLPNAIDKVKTKTILFGNSKNKGNNHLDVLELLQNTTLQEEITIKMFFSYGPEGTYAKEVRAKANKLDRIELIENFLSKEQFNQLYEQAAALIFNGYRQMALGNIFTAINCGVKVYLSERNMVYHWLIKNGIQVYSIEKHLKGDLEVGDILLSKKAKQQNSISLSKLIAEMNLENFQLSVGNILKS